MNDVTHVTIFGIKMTLNRVAFTLPIGDGWNVYWYGIIIAFGFFLALVYAYKRADRFDVDFNRLTDVIIVAVPVSIICARAYYLIFEPNSSLKEFFKIHNGGLAIYGGVIGALLAATIMCKFKNIRLFDALDLASVGFLIGQGIGRWGNFINQEAFGKPTGSSFWGMTSENVVSDFISNGYDSTALAHPCFLYESVWCIAGFFVLNALSKKRKFSGEIALTYCVWYGFGRAIIEHLRTDSLGYNIKVSEILSIVICVAALITLIIKRRKISVKRTALQFVGGGENNINGDDTNDDN